MDGSTQPNITRVKTIADIFNGVSTIEYGTFKIISPNGADLKAAKLTVDEIPIKLGEAHLKVVALLIDKQGKYLSPSDAIEGCGSTATGVQTFLTTNIVNIKKNIARGMKNAGAHPGRIRVITESFESYLAKPGDKPRSDTFSTPQVGAYKLAAL